MEERQCSNCGKQTPANARFCPHCGESISVITGIACANCGTVSPVSTTRCPDCGESLTSDEQPDLFAPPPSDAWEQRLADLYMRLLERTVLDQQDARQVDAYFQRFHESGFSRDLELRLRHLARDLTRDGAEEPTQEVLFEIYDQIDYFLIRHCADINQVYLPEAMLKYTRPDAGRTDLYRMAMDHLAFDREDVRVYTDFLAMPERTLRRASRSFLFADRSEKLWFICDQSVSGNGKTGFAMTNRSLYWKAPMQSPHVFRYGHHLEVEFENNWINLNGSFFDAGQGVNVRLTRLLRRLQTIF